ncbi:MAG TPA: amino acid adenylation domain-containing protein, partial [Steroidobacteraceae bacterium]
AYVPLDPSYPRERLEYLLQDAAPRVVLTLEHLKSVLPRASSPVIALDTDWPAIARRSGDDFAAGEAGTTAQHLAYLIYTSGSTGQPKGVMVEHANVGRLFDATREYFHFDAQDTWTLFHSFAFDFSVWEIWGALLHGGRLIVVPYMTSRTPHLFYQLLCEQGATVLNQTPTAFLQVMAQGEASATGSRNSLRLVIFGGEALVLRSLRPWIERNGAERPALVNMYGITETTVHVTYRRLLEDDIRNEQRSVIGQPMGDLRLYILDNCGRPVPPGMRGELFVGGAGLARGYLNQPQLTAERFVSGLLPGAAAQRLYKTGDLGRLLSDGGIEYLGREDHQVKIRGFRIELGEIEAQLARHPGVKEAIVLARTGVSGDKQLVAYVTHRGEAPSPDALRRRLKETLPDHMLPAAFGVLSEWPLTVNGKLDINALPAAVVSSGSEAGYLAPGNVMERQLCDIWAGVLQVERVGVNDNFFALGGDSIRSLQIVNAAKSAGFNITVADLFAHQTVAELARAAQLNTTLPLDHRPADLRLLELPALPPAAWPAGVIDVYPLAAMQSVMVEQYEGNRVHGLGIYHAQQWLSFHDPSPSAEAMRRAVDLIVSAHPVLRTVLIRLPGGELVQGIKESLAVEFTEHSLRSMSPEEQERYVREAILHDRMRPFPVDGTSALLRYHWFDIAPDRFVLLFSIHHAIDDGWGNQNLLGTLFYLYGRICSGDVPELAPVSNVYKEFVALVEETQRSQTARSFWDARRLNATGMSCLRRQQPVEAQNSFGRLFAIDRALGKALGQLARAHNVSVKAVLLHAYLELIGRHCGTAAPTVGVVTNGRSARLSDPLNALGLYWTLLPFGTEPGSEDLGPTLKGIQDELTASENHALYPLPMIEERFGPGELFFATFNFVHFHNAAQARGQASLTLLSEAGHDKFHYPLNYLFSMNATDGGIGVHVEYDNVYFPDACIVEMNAALIEILSGLARGAI